MVGHSLVPIALYIINHFILVFAIPPQSRRLVLRDGIQDPTDPSWIKNFAALGDSYAAGIGAGDVLSRGNDASCSRFSAAYPVLMHNMGFGAEPRLTHLACSGDRSAKVVDQVKQLADNSQDLITISAGGNDALLSEVLKACVYLPGSEDNCNQKLAETKKAIDDELTGNIDRLLQAIAPKVRQGGVVVYTLYAQFFNAQTDVCSSQTWNWFNDIIPGDGGIRLTKDLRQKLNDLVLEANRKIQSAIASQSGSNRPSRLNILRVDWDQAVQDNQGRFCEEGSKDDPSDPSNAGLMFQRLDVGKHFIPPGKRDELAKRDVKGSITLNSRKEHFPHELDKRVPDSIARVFHPTILGHELIATLSTQAVFDFKMKGFNGQVPACPIPSPFVPPPSKNPKAECNPGLSSGLPANVFKTGTYAHFCDAVEKDPGSKLEWVVTADGNQRADSGRTKRSPPPDLSLYNGLTVILRWSGGDGSCSTACRDAFYNMAQGQCGSTASEQNKMACSAKSASNCGGGTFEYQIHPGPSSKATCKPKEDEAPKIPQPGPRVCRKYIDAEVNKCGAKDIQLKTLNNAIFFLHPPSGTIEVAQMYNYTMVYGRSGPTYLTSMSYIPGCTAFKTQDIENPLGGKPGDPPDKFVSSADIIRNTFIECRGNHGHGGYQDFGCVRYGFYPTRIKGVFTDAVERHYELYWNAKNKWCGDG
ncbi:MAG: hypothetical protein Q9174_002458 [Haloplaca sp. 1 TL-2023]